MLVLQGGGGKGSYPLKFVEETHYRKVLLFEFYGRFSQKLRQSTAMHLK